MGDPFYLGMEQFTGDIYLAYGANDPMAGLLAYVLQSGALSARSLHIRQVPDCDHRFSGGTNSKVLSNAFHWILDTYEDFPSPRAGFSSTNETPYPSLDAIQWATRSPIIIVVQFVFARMTSGITEASATRNPSIP